jgi:type IV conjugative transfer system coupling protein TraD
MSNTTQTFAFTQGGQTQIHKMRMLKQVTVSTFKISLFMGLVTFISYYFYTNYWMNILMYPFWGLAECMNLMKLVFRNFKGFTYIVDIDYKMIVKCTPDYFLGSTYARKLIAYLNYTMIQGAIYAVISMVITVFASIYYFMRKGKTLKNTKQLSGIKISNITDFKNTLKKQKVRTCLTIDKMPIPFEAETKHFMISGTTGSGKSNMINHLLKAIEERGDKAVIVDTTGGFVEKFYQEGRDTILNPYDARTKDWCLWSEPLNQTYEFNDLAESLIEKQHNDVFWANTSRQAVTAMLKHIKHHSRDLAEGLDILLTKPLRETQAIFKGTAVESLFAKENERTVLSIRATLTTQLESLYSLKNNKTGFSVDDWIKDVQSSGFLFLSGLPKQRAALRPLWSVWLNIAVKSVMDLRPNPNRRIWFIVDELSSLNKLPCLDMALAEGRKYGACMVLGFQTMAQIQEIYGTRGTKSLSELMVNKFLFQAVDFDNALLLSRFFGERQILESHENVSFGANEIRDGVSLTHHKKTESIIRASDLMELKPLHFYSRIAGQNTCIKGDFNYFNNPSISHAFIEQEDFDDTIGKQKNEERALSQQLAKNQSPEEDNADENGVHHENESALNNESIAMKPVTPKDLEHKNPFLKSVGDHLAHEK